MNIQLLIKNHRIFFELLIIHAFSSSGGGRKMDPKTKQHRKAIAQNSDDWETEIDEFEAKNIK